MKAFVFALLSIFSIFAYAAGSQHYECVSLKNPELRILAANSWSTSFDFWSGTNKELIQGRLTFLRTDRGLFGYLSNSKTDLDHTILECRSYAGN